MASLQYVWSPCAAMFSREAESSWHQPDSRVGFMYATALVLFGNIILPFSPDSL